MRTSTIVFAAAMIAAPAVPSLAFATNPTQTVNSTGAVAVCSQPTGSTTPCALNATGGGTLGAGVQATGADSIAVGAAGTDATGTGATAVGPGATAGGTDSAAFGVVATASGDYSTALGNNAMAPGGGSTAVGAGSYAAAEEGVALGAGAQAIAGGSVALGANALATAPDTVSVGSDGSDGGPVFQSQIVNMAAGTAPLDAVNLAQLDAAGNAIAAWTGGGAAFEASGAGTFTAPSFVLTNPYTKGTYHSVSGAITALDTAIGGVPMGSGSGAQGPAGPRGPAGPAGPQGQAGKNGVGVVQFTDALHTTARVGTSGAGPEQAQAPVVLQNVAPGAAGTDAANVAQMQQGDAQTLKAANAYTDAHAVEYVPHSDPIVALRPDTTLENVAAGTAGTDAVNVAQLDASQAAGENWARSYTNYATQRALTAAEQYTDAIGAGLNRRIDYALSSAMADAQAAAALAGQSRDEPNRIAVGAGDTAGVSAMNVTYQHLLPGGHWAFNVGASVSAGSERSTTIGGGVSYGW